MTGVTKSRQPAVPGRWAESGPLAALRNEMDDLFASFFGSALPAPLKAKKITIKG